jgi:aryl-alcohol dehydrogenase-like predicted oxidoreductase
LVRNTLVTLTAERVVTLNRNQVVTFSEISMQRTVEDELVPMALELGLGITPWSPLKGGLLSGKYNRRNMGKADGRFAMRNGGAVLNEKKNGIIFFFVSHAEVDNKTTAAKSLKWVKKKPGVASTIIGVRTIEQLDANIAATEVHLSAEDIASLDQLSAPPVTFLAEYKDMIPMMQHGGIEINGVKPVALPLMTDMQPGKY